MPRKPKTKAFIRKETDDTKRLKAWRDATGYTQQETAKILELSPQAIYDYERGRTPVPKPVWMALNGIHKLPAHA
jgi:DNA-binding XRE family transcriptional regulator